MVVTTVDVPLEEAGGELPHDEINKAAIAMLMSGRLDLALLANFK